MAAISFTNLVKFYMSLSFLRYTMRIDDNKKRFLLQNSMKDFLTQKGSVEKYISVPYSFLSKLAVCNSKAIFSRVVRLLISSSLGISF